MPENNIDRILDNLLHVLPVFHKKVTRLGLGGMIDDLTPHQLAIMGILGERSLTATELANRLAAKKPQMTFLVEQLVRIDMVERHPDIADRRVVNLALSEKGRARFIKIKKEVKENMRERLGALTPEEIDEMSSALETLRGIVTKL